VALNKYLNTTKTETTQIFFQIEFKGLSGFGNNPIDIMRLNIPGYVPLSQKPIPLSRFETYE
jgi:LPS-assembly protein